MMVSDAESVVDSIQSRYYNGYVDGDDAANRNHMACILAPYLDIELGFLKGYITHTTTLRAAGFSEDFLAAFDAVMAERNGASKLSKVVGVVRKFPQHIITPVHTSIDNVVSRHVYKKSLRTYMAEQGRAMRANREEVNES